MPSRLVITGDLLRANPDGTFNQRLNLVWFSAIFKSSFERFFNNVEVIGIDPNSFPFPAFYGAVYGTRDLISLEQWAYHYDMDLPSEAQELLSERLNGATVLTFEGSPSLLRSIDINGSCYINIRVHPLRFASDLIFSFESNNPNIQRRLNDFSISDDYIYGETNYCRSIFSTRTRELEGTPLIFLGQVRNDASVIQDGKFASLDLYRDLLLSSFDTFTFYHKPHPFDKDNPSIDEWRCIFPKSTLLEGNIYSLFPAPKHQYVTFSSGAGYEAELFGHRATYLLRKHWGHGGSIAERFVNILDMYWYPSFWEYILGISDCAPGAESYPFVPNRLRRTIRVKWNLLS